MSNPNNPRDYVMRDYADRDERSVAVQLLGRPVVRLIPADGNEARSTSGAIASALTPLAGLGLGAWLVMWLNAH